METIKEILMRRDGNTAEEADERITEAKAMIDDYLADGDMEAAYDVCRECFGLEPDYLIQLID